MRCWRNTPNEAESDNARTVAAMDVLAPGIGEIIGGSQREERLEVLDQSMAERGIDKEHYAWYRDLRRYGTVPHAGFGLAPAFAGAPCLRHRPRQRPRRYPLPKDARQRTILAETPSGRRNDFSHPGAETAQLSSKWEFDCFILGIVIALWRMSYLAR